VPLGLPSQSSHATATPSTSTASSCETRLLILGPRHFDRVLRIYVHHYNRRRPHRGLALPVPESLGPVEAVDTVPDIERRDLPGGLVHEYRRAA